jgi:exportin-T
MHRLVELWVGSIPGFDTYVLNEVLPVCFSAPAQPHFTLKNAAAPPLLEANAALQKAILAKLGAELGPYLRDRLLPSLGCSAEFSAEYVRQLCEADVRQLRDFISAQLISR